MSKGKRRGEEEMFELMEKYMAIGLWQHAFCESVGVPKSVFQYWWRR